MVLRRLFIGLILFIISLLLCLDLFISPGRPSTFDGPTHLANIAQFTKAIQDGDFPVRWMNGFGNYGMPTGIVAQQTTSYLGAVINLFTHNIFLSYNVVILIGAFLSTYFIYIFLQLHFSQTSAILGAIFFNFAPYRIINIYIRGAAPEFFSNVFFPVVFIGLYLFLGRKGRAGLLYLLIGLVGIILTHPFTLIIGLFLWIPYSIWLIWKNKSMEFIKENLNLIILTALLIFGVCSFYIFPLYLEVKYFYYGTGSHFIPGNFLTFKNYFGDHWLYFYQNDIEVRGHIIHLGLIEGAVLMIGFITVFLTKRERGGFLIWVLPSFLLIMYLTTQYADYFYRNVNILGNIQHNWRMFTSIIFIAPFVLAYLYDKSKSKILLLTIVLSIIVLRFPQLYGKNYIVEKQEKYYWTKLNLHGNIMNTIWTGPTQDYPVKKFKGEIIEGKGRITMREEHNSWRRYVVDASTDVRMADYTFYFPGWRAYIDGKQVPIEFQDMNYRGVITYRVPSGTHNILVKFTDTKVRLLSNIISLVSIGALGMMIVFRKRLFHHPPKQRT